MRIGEILNWAYYPWAIVMAFRYYAYEQPIAMLVLFIFIVAIAVVTEISGRLLEKQVRALKLVVVKMACHIDELKNDEQADALADIHADEHPSK